MALFKTLAVLLSKQALKQGAKETMRDFVLVIVLGLVTLFLSLGLLTLLLWALGLFLMQTYGLSLMAVLLGFTGVSAVIIAGLGLAIFTKLKALKARKDKAQKAIPAVSAGILGVSLLVSALSSKKEKKPKTPKL